MSSSRAAKHLCVILTLAGKNANEEQLHLEALRAFLQSRDGELRDGDEKITISYLHTDKQKDFMDQFHTTKERAENVNFHGSLPRMVFHLNSFDFRMLEMSLCYGDSSMRGRNTLGCGQCGMEQTRPKVGSPPNRCAKTSTYYRGAHCEWIPLWFSANW